MFRYEVYLFYAVVSISFIYLSIAWISEKMKVCDELVLSAWMLAPKTIKAAMWMAFVCFALYGIPNDKVSLGVLIGWLICFGELLTLFSRFTAACKRSKVLKVYYTTFEENVLKGVERLSQHDFERAVNDIIHIKLAGDDFGMAYFCMKCQKYAKRNGLTWEG